MAISTFAFPTTIHFGVGARSRILDALAGAGSQRPLIVTDAGIAKLPLLDTVKAALEGLEVGVYSDFEGNPLKSHVDRGVAAYNAHQADSIVALGGGAAMDVAKAIQLMIHHPGDLFDYIDGDPNALPIDQALPYLVTVPTTAGTGSEVGRSTVISTDDTHAKKIMFSPRMMPSQVFADPELLVGLPPRATAATGMDALTHLVETYLAQGYHPMADGIALQGVRMIAQNLVKSFRNPSDLEARGQMLMASIMGGVAFQKGLGLTHSLAHALSTVYDLHHGLANGIVIPYAMRYNLVAVPERLADLAEAAGCEARTGDAFIAWLEQLQRDLDIPAKLGEVGVAHDKLDALTKVAFADVCHPLGPRPCTADDLRSVYTEAI